MIYLVEGDYGMPRYNANDLLKLKMKGWLSTVKYVLVETQA